MADSKNKDEIRSAVQKHYADAITSKSECCGSANTDPAKFQSFVSALGYSSDDILTAGSGVASFGCGNPVALLEVSEGQTVLDLGSGAGYDLILAAKKVGPDGKVIGLDMTPEMIATCRANLERAGITNAEVREGHMEQMPVADGEVDWIISNCVINLSPEKEKVFAEAYRVLKPGGRVMVSDLVTRGLPEDARNDLEVWAKCIGGAVEEHEYIRLVEEAGFEDVKVVDRMPYAEESIDAVTESACGCSPSQSSVTNAELAERVSGRVFSIRLSARKPQ